MQKESVSSPPLPPLGDHWRFARDGWNKGLKTELQSYRISPLSVQRRANKLNPELAGRRGNSIALSRPSHVMRRKPCRQINLSLVAGSAISGN